MTATTARKPIDPEKVKDFASHITREFSIGGKRVVVLDGLFSEDTVRSIHKFVSELPHQCNAADSKETAHHKRWKCDFPKGTEEKPFFARIRDIVVQGGIFPEQPLELLRIYSNFNFYGEVFFNHLDSTDGVTALYYVNPTWEHDWSGETFFCDESGESIQVVQPKAGRLVLFDASILHRGSPPSRLCPEHRINIAFKFIPVGYVPIHERKKTLKPVK